MAPSKTVWVWAGRHHSLHLWSLNFGTVKAEQYCVDGVKWRLPIYIYCLYTIVTSPLFLVLINLWNVDYCTMMLLIKKIVLQMYIPWYQNLIQSSMYVNTVFHLVCFRYYFMCLVTSVVRVPETFGTTAYGWNSFPHKTCFEHYCSVVVWNWNLLIQPSLT
jgi:hypothetical protein